MKTEIFQGEIYASDMVYAVLDLIVQLENAYHNQATFDTIEAYAKAIDIWYKYAPKKARHVYRERYMQRVAAVTL